MMKSLTLCIIYLISFAVVNSVEIQSDFEKNRLSETERVKRQSGSIRGKFRGQTQSQYLNFGDKSQDGKAEAEATQHSSRATVVGKNGMGQAQSQSSGGDCSDCVESRGIYDVIRPDPLRSPLHTVQDEIKIRGPVGTGTYATFPGTNNDDQNKRNVDRPGYIAGTIDGSQLGDSERSRSETTYPSYQQTNPKYIGNIGNTDQIPSYSATMRPGNNGDGFGGRTDSRAPQLPLDVNLQQNSMPGSSGRTVDSLMILPKDKVSDQTGDMFISGGVDSQRLRPDDIHKSDHIPAYIGPILGGSQPNGDSLIQSGPGSLPRGLENNIGIRRPGNNPSDINQLKPGGTKFDLTQPGNIPINGKSEILSAGTGLQSGGFGDGSLIHPGGSDNTFNNRRLGMLDNVNFQREISNVPGYPQNAQNGVGALFQAKGHINPGAEQTGLTDGHGSQYHVPKLSGNGHEYYSGPDGKTHLINYPNTDQTLQQVSPGGLTVLVGTGGTRQTVIGSDGRITSLGQDNYGPKQTVYAPSAGLTVLVGTHGAHQTLHTLPPGYSATQNAEIAFSPEKKHDSKMGTYQNMFPGIYRPASQFIPKEGFPYETPEQPTQHYYGKPKMYGHPGIQQQGNNQFQPGYQYELPNERKTAQVPIQNGYASFGQDLLTNTQQREQESLSNNLRGKIDGRYEPVIQGQVVPHYNDHYQPGVMQQTVDRSGFKPKIQTGGQYIPGSQNNVNGNQGIFIPSPQYENQYKLGGQPIVNNFGHQTPLHGQVNQDSGNRYQPGITQPEIDKSLYYPRGQTNNPNQPGPQPTGGLGNQNAIYGSPHPGNQYQSGLRQPDVYPPNLNPQSHVGGQYQVDTPKTNGLPREDQYRTNQFQQETPQQRYYPGGQTSDNFKPVTQYGLVHQGVAQRPSDSRPGIHAGEQMGSVYQQSGIGSQNGSPITSLDQRPEYNSNAQPGYQNGQSSYQNGGTNIGNNRNRQTPSGTQPGIYTNQYQPSSQATQQEYGRIPQNHEHGQRIPADLITDRQQIMEDINRRPQINNNANVRPFVEYGTEHYPSSVDRQTGFQTNQPQNSGNDADKKNEVVQKSEDDSFSQAESSIKNGQAIASAQGRKNGGTAQTQVTGTYGGNGSFSASAQTSDKDRSAQAQVTGGKDGALSSAQGSGGVGKSQSQVNLNTKTGGTSATSQSGGLKHESQSEVQANEKGGLADAQANGPGQTSSQAQIGFKPQNEDNDNQKTIFNGGGTASAQSSAHTGQSQSQINGNFKYGISYHGAAQSASGTKEQVSQYREKNRQLFQAIANFGKEDSKPNSNESESEVESDTENPKDSNDDMKTRKSQQKSVVTFPPPEPHTKLEEDPEYEEEDDEYEEYDYSTDKSLEPKSGKAKDDLKQKSEKEVTTVTAIMNKNLNGNGSSRTYTQQTPLQKQTAVVANPNEKHRLVQIQNGRTVYYPSTTEKYTDRFNKIVHSKESTEENSSKVEKTTKSKYLPKNLSRNNDLKTSHSDHRPSPESYVTVTKSISGSLDDNKLPNVESTYFTKSSTCGYFTFSCNIVYGSNGRSKICRPKAPSNGKC